MNATTFFLRRNSGCVLRPRIAEHMVRLKVVCLCAAARPFDIDSES